MATTGESFRIADIEKKGKGMISTRAISSGELILLEPPLFTQKVPYTEITVTAAVRSLSPAQQREFFSLTNCHRGTLSPAVGVFKTNAFPCGDTGGGTFVDTDAAAIFFKGSRFNSSCLPNVNNYWDDQAQQIGFRAVRDIAEGEELCVCYSDFLQTREQRQRGLRSNFGFVCKCETCSLEGEALRLSDERRERVARLYEEIAGCGSNPSLGVRKVKLALQLLKQEGLLKFVEASYCYDAFQFCISVSDTKNAKLWITKSWEAYCRVRGPESADAKRSQGFMQNPRGHLAFGLLGKKVLSGPDP